MLFQMALFPQVEVTGAYYKSVTAYFLHTLIALIAGTVGIRDGVSLPTVIHLSYQTSHLVLYMPATAYLLEDPSGVSQWH